MENDQAEQQLSGAGLVGVAVFSTDDAAQRAGVMFFASDSDAKKALTSLRSAIVNGSSSAVAAEFASGIRRKGSEVLSYGTLTDPTVRVAFARCVFEIRTPRLSFLDPFNTRQLGRPFATGGS